MIVRVFGHSLWVVFLTLLTQLGGVAWLIALLFRRRLLVFLIAYGALAIGASAVAPLFGRVALSCWREGPLQVQSWFYCAANRVYVTPELAAALEDVAETVDAAHPGAITLVLDGSFPFIDGFPLLPHLSHDDGEKADLAFFYADDRGYAPGLTRSPIGYFAFEDGPTSCPAAGLSLRWDLAPLQPLWREARLEPRRTRALLKALAQDPRIGKILLEPHLRDSLRLSHPKIRFQGCRAARHDDHIHVQL
ncbi:MAG: hypothetical protein AAGM38_02805 [Pseudomonadota bacterium]